MSNDMPHNIPCTLNSSLSRYTTDCILTSAGLCKLYDEDDDTVFKEVRQTYLKLFQHYSEEVCIVKLTDFADRECRNGLLNCSSFKSFDTCKKINRIVYCEYKNMQVIVDGKLSIGRVETNGLVLDTKLFVESKNCINSRMTCVVIHLKEIDCLMLYWYGGLCQITSINLCGDDSIETCLVKNTMILKVINLGMLAESCKDGARKLLINLSSGDSFSIGLK